MQDMEYTRPLPELSRPPEEYAPVRRRPGRRLPPDDKLRQEQREQERQRRKRRRRMARLAAGAAAATVLLTAPAPAGPQKGDFYIYGFDSNYTGPPVLLQGDTVSLPGAGYQKEDSRVIADIRSEKALDLADGLTVEFEFCFEEQDAPEPVELDHPQEAVYLGDYLRGTESFYIRNFREDHAPEENFSDYLIHLIPCSRFCSADGERTENVPQGNICLFFRVYGIGDPKYFKDSIIPLLRPGAKDRKDEAIAEYPDGFFNSWHTMGYRLGPDGSVQVLVDGELFSESTLPFEPREVSFSISGVRSRIEKDGKIYYDTDYILIRGLKVNGKPATYTPLPED